MNNKSPVIVVGAGRSGSTVFHQLFSKHPNLAWLPGALCRRFPRNPRLYGLFMQGLDYPVVGGLLEEIKPGECYSFWEYHCKGFSAPYRDLVADDVTIRARERVLGAMAKVTTSKRRRMLLKITGWPRMGFLSQIFEDAKFIHMIRDGRAVANSMTDVEFWTGWRGPADWGWGELSPAYQEEWDKYDQSFVALAGIQWKILMDAVEKAKKEIDGSAFLEVRYEDLCSDPVGTFKKVTSFCKLDWTASFEQELNKQRLSNTNEKFRRDLTPKQQYQLEELLEDPLVRYGYL